MCQDCGCEEAGWKVWSQKSLLAIKPVGTRKIHVEESVLKKNDEIAAQNRKWFLGNGIKVLNLMSSPGSGKTMLLEETVKRFSEMDFSLSILTGDQAGSFDTERLQRHGARVKQINTMNSCHLDASMIQRELGSFVEPKSQILIVENVGNLVCPAAFDLGEEKRVAFLSTTEGEDKPSKYPLLFKQADLVVLTKMDLRPHLSWNLEECYWHLQQINPTVSVLETSAKTGMGLDLWMDFLRSGI